MSPTGAHRRRLREGADPAQQRQLDKPTRPAVAGITVQAVAHELHAPTHSGWSPRCAARWIVRRAKAPFPWIGGLPPKDIAALLLHMLRRIENRGAHENAHTLRQTHSCARSATSSAPCTSLGGWPPGLQRPQALSSRMQGRKALHGWQGPAGDLTPAG